MSAPALHAGQVVTFLGYSDDVVGGLLHAVGTPVTVVHAYDARSEWPDGAIVETSRGWRGFVWSWEVAQ